MYQSHLKESVMKRKSNNIQKDSFFEHKKVRFSESSQSSIIKNFNKCAIDVYDQQDTDMLYCDANKENLTGSPVVLKNSQAELTSSNDVSQSNQPDSNLLYDNEIKEKPCRNPLYRALSEIPSCNQSYETDSNTSLTLSINNTPNYFNLCDTPLTFDKVNEIGIITSTRVSKVPLRRIKTTPANLSNAFVSPIVYHKKDIKFDIERYQSCQATTTFDEVATSEKWVTKDTEYVSSDEVANIVENDYASINNRFHIIDCRYPYEFEGGHIDGAENIYTPFQLLNYVFRKDPTESNYKFSDSNNEEEKVMENLRKAQSYKNLWWLNDIFIFHCEFSSKRAPRLACLLRQIDRFINLNKYPALSIPKVCILRGGYAEFFKRYSKLCSPKSYMKMDLDNSFESRESYDNNRYAHYNVIVKKQLNVVHDFFSEAKSRQSNQPNKF